MRVLVGCWRAAVSLIVGIAVLQVFVDIWDEGGFVWSDAGKDSVAWSACTVVWAAVAWLSLRHRSRAAGVPLAPEALADRQTHQLRVLRPSEGWPDRMLAELKASDRVVVTAEKGREEIWFRWRLGRRRNMVWGSIAFDDASGAVLLDMREEEGAMGVAGLRKGAAFVAVCQIAGVLGLGGAQLRGGAVEFR
ncbi:hypothetical protein ABZT04_20310 [Streptomyces sp. NPDC005492]|uniref:hypothetical protein n=1 Tax=Streptomyces sp. NPDC005492 TaxID=3156883 RepID=UPI0033B59410